VRNLEAGARTLRLTLVWTEVKTVAQAAKTLDAVARQRVEALVTVHSSTLYTARRQIVAFALQHRLPMISGVRRRRRVDDHGSVDWLAEDDDELTGVILHACRAA
jgi:hypothetical protein